MRGHNEGSLYYSNRDRRWVAAVSLDDGRRVTRSARSKAEARDRLKELQRLKDAGAVDGSRLTLGAYLASWLDDVRPRLAPATWRKHESIVRVHLVPRLGHVRLSELSVRHCRDALGGLGRDLDAQSVRHVRATLRRGLADAQREGLVSRNVAALAEPPPLPHRERPILTADQVRSLIDGTRDDRLHALWVLLATTGLREAEALALTWEDIEDGAVRVRHTLHKVPGGDFELRPPKTAKSRRTVTLPAVTLEALRAHRTRQREEWLAAGRPGEIGLVFTTAPGHRSHNDPKGLGGRPLHGTNLTKALYAHLDLLGLPRVHVHDLRHSTATILYGAGVPLEAIADMLGHSTTRVTADLYRHRVPELQRDLADAMQKAVS